MSYDIDTFVNTNNYNAEMYVDDIDAVDCDDMFEMFPTQFARDNNIAYDTVNRDADPVVVYELNGAPVAWYDCENLYGFVAK